MIMRSLVLARERPIEYDCNIKTYFWIDLAQIKFSSASTGTVLDANFVAILSWMLAKET